MTKGKQHYKDNIFEETYTRFYVATNTAMIEYPWIVGRYDESTPTLVDVADEYILDSAIGDETVGNEDVLDRADSIGASVVVAADVMGEPHTTTDRIVDMVKRAQQRERDYEVLVPLQFDEDTSHADHYDEVAGALAAHDYDIDDFRLYVGGLIEIDYEEQIRRCIELREHVGEEAYIHGLGVGAAREWVVTIRKCPWLLDSIDNSSIVKNIVYNGKIWTMDGEWEKISFPRGSNSTVLTCEQLECCLHLYNYMISDCIDERDALTEFREPQSALARRVRQHQQWHRSPFADVIQGSV